MIETSEVELPEAKTQPSFILQWVLVCVIGYAIGMPSGSWAGGHGYSIWDSFINATGLTPEVQQYNYVFASGLMGATLGGIISFSQWLVLRKYIHNATWWILIGLTCNFAGIALNGIFPERFLFDYYAPTLLTASGTGYLEWLLMRKSLPSNGWIITRIAMNLATMLVANINIEAQSAFNLSGSAIYVGNSIMGLISGLIAGVISGFSLNSFIGRIHSTSQGDTSTATS
jgi:hypothetical protein